jgi:uncharacterized protein (UPF0332 family)/predicted nucleotidyltransferase
MVSRFSKYIMCFGMFGSMASGDPSRASDIDVFIVVDDTDTRNMSREDLKEKMREVAKEMAGEIAAELAIPLAINVQAYLLTGFWNHLREANPIIITVLRTGISFYDRGLLRPWQLLLKNGIIHPSIEAVERHLDSGEEMFNKSRNNIELEASQNMYFTAMAASQALLMSIGLAPSTPRESFRLLNKYFVETGKLPVSVVKLIQQLLHFRKAIEHNSPEKPTAQQIGKAQDELKHALTCIRQCADDALVFERLKQLSKMVEDCERLLDNRCMELLDTETQIMELSEKLELLREKGVIPGEMLGLGKELENQLAMLGESKNPGLSEIDRTYRMADYLFIKLQIYLGQ